MRDHLVPGLLGSLLVFFSIYIRPLWVPCGSEENGKQHSTDNTVATIILCFSLIHFWQTSDLMRTYFLKDSQRKFSRLSTGGIFLVRTKSDKAEFCRCFTNLKDMDSKHPTSGKVWIQTCPDLSSGYPGIQNLCRKTTDSWKNPLLF